MVLVYTTDHGFRWSKGTVAIRILRSPSWSVRLEVSITLKDSGAVEAVPAYSSGSSAI
jgi:hypothetical protein